jgi:hypothetical protein
VSERTANVEGDNVELEGSAEAEGAAFRDIGAELGVVRAGILLRLDLSEMYRTRKDMLCVLVVRLVDVFVGNKL